MKNKIKKLLFFPYLMACFFILFLNPSELESIELKEIKRIMSGGDLYKMNISPDGKYLVTGTKSGRLDVVRINEKTEKISLLEEEGTEIVLGKKKVGDAAILDVEFHFLKENILAVAFKNNKIEIWDIIQKEKIKTISTFSEPSYISFLPSGNILISASRTGELTLWDIESGKLLNSFGGYEICDVAFAPNRKYLAVTTIGSSDKIIIWEIKDRNNIKENVITLPLKGLLYRRRGCGGHYEYFEGSLIEFSKDEKYLYWGTYDKKKKKNIFIIFEVKE